MRRRRTSAVQRRPRGRARRRTPASRSCCASRIRRRFRPSRCTAGRRMSAAAAPHRASGARARGSRRVFAEPAPGVDSRHLRSARRMQTLLDQPSRANAILIAALDMPRRSNAGSARCGARRRFRPASARARGAGSDRRRKPQHHAERRRPRPRRCARQTGRSCW